LIVLIDLKGKSPMADTMIVASGRSHRHVGALADHLQRTLKEQGLGKVKVSGLPHCDWVLLDAGDVIVHLFRPEVRAFYNIEKIWSVDSGHPVGALADRLQRTLKGQGLGKVQVSGLPHCDWVLLDAGDVFVHLFRPEARALYNI